MVETPVSSKERPVTTPTLIALAFAVVATVEWSRLPLLGRLYLAAATAYAVAAVDGAGAVAFGSPPHDGIGYVVATAGVIGLAALAASAAARLLGAAAAARR
jgi:hypothetical protein